MALCDSGRKVIEMGRSTHWLGRFDRAGLALAGGLVVLDVAMRLLPHTPNFTPVAATALFAGARLRGYSASLAVPLVAMLVSDKIIGFYDWRVMCVVYLALLLPAPMGMLARRHDFPIVLLPLAAASSVIFFVASNFAVWEFGNIYNRDLAGLTECYIAGLPFLRNTLSGDIFWMSALLGLLGLTRFAAKVLFSHNNLGLCARQKMRRCAASLARSLTLRESVFPY